MKLNYVELSDEKQNQLIAALVNRVTYMEKYMMANYKDYSVEQLSEYLKRVGITKSI